MKPIAKFLFTIYAGIIIACLLTKFKRNNVLADKAAAACRKTYENRKVLAIAVLVLCPGILMNVMYMAVVYTIKDILRDAYNRQVVYTV